MFPAQEEMETGPWRSRRRRRSHAKAIAWAMSAMMAAYHRHGSLSNRQVAELCATPKSTVHRMIVTVSAEESEMTAKRIGLTPLNLDGLSTEPPERVKATRAMGFGD